MLNHDDNLVKSGRWQIRSAALERELYIQAAPELSSKIPAICGQAVISWYKGSWDWYQDHGQPCGPPVPSSDDAGSIHIVSNDSRFLPARPTEKPERMTHEDMGVVQARIKLLPWPDFGPIRPFHDEIFRCRDHILESSLRHRISPHSPSLAG